MAEEDYGHEDDQGNFISPIFGSTDTQRSEPQSSQAQGRLAGVDPRKIEAMKAMLASPIEGVDPRKIEAMKRLIGFQDEARLYKNEGANQYGAQHPAERAINAVGEVAQDMLGANPLHMYGQTVEGFGNAIDQGVSDIPHGQEINDALFKKQGMGYGDMGPLQPIADMAPNSLGQLGAAAANPIQIMQEGARLSAKGGGKLLVNLEENDAARKASLRKLGPGATNILGDPAAESRLADERALKDQNLSNIDSALDRTQDNISRTQNALNASPLPLGEKQLPLGLDVKGQGLVDNIDLKTYTDKQPLAAQANKNIEKAKNLPPVEAKPIIDKAYEVKDTLMGLLKESKDTAVERVINKYLKLEDNPSLFPEGRESAEAVRPEDLLKDRGVLGKERVRLMAKGGRDTEQSAAILTLQKAIDDSVDKVAGKSPGLRAALKENRQGWSDFYSRQYSDTANSLRNSDSSEVLKKIFSNHDTVNEAKAAMGEDAFGYAKEHLKTQLDQELEKAVDPVKVAENYKKNREGFLERVLSKDELAQYNEKAQYLADRKIREDQLQKFLEDRDNLLKAKGEESIRQVGKPARRAGDLPSRESLGRAGDRTHTDANWLRGGSAGFGAAAATAAAVGHPALSALFSVGSAIAIAPEAMARLYLEATPATKSLIDKSVTAYKRLGKLAPLHPLSVVLSRQADENSK